MAADALDPRSPPGAVVLSWAARYVGIPFAPCGFDPSGCHCWGIVHLVYRRELGIALPQYDTIAFDDVRAVARRVRDEAALADWTPVVGPRRDFDVVLMATLSTDGAGALRRFAGHVGLAVGATHILHVEQGIDAICVAADHAGLRQRIIGSYRHISEIVAS